jgi:hypothetical protein
MKRHLERKIKCFRNISSFKINEAEIYRQSLTLKKEPIYNNVDNNNNIMNDNIMNDNNNINININNNNNSSIITTENNENNTTHEINNLVIQNTNPENSIQCEYCNKFFSEKYNVRKHQKRSCKGLKKLELDKINNIGNNKQDINNINNNLNIEKQVNISNKTNNSNNIIIINQHNLEGFDDKWTTEHIDNYIRQMILLSDHKYTNLLDEILKNKSNLNVIMNNDQNYGLVYKNKEDMYVNMKVREIIDKSIEKLYEQLNIFYTELVNNDIVKVNTEIIEHEKQIIDNKFKEFCTNNNVKSSVGHLLTKIYEKNNEEALNIAQKVITYSKTMDNQIGF